jgi:hypothetical protein
MEAPRAIALRPSSAVVTTVEVPTVVATASTCATTTTAGTVVAVVGWRNFIVVGHRLGLTGPICQRVQTRALWRPSAPDHLYG